MQKQMALTYCQPTVHGGVWLLQEGSKAEFQWAFG